MNIRIYRFLLLISLILTAGCSDSINPDARKSSWSSEKPLAISFKLREQRYNRLNLLRNGGFETGRVFSIDSVRKSFAIDGWQLLGTGVEWADTSLKGLYGRAEVFSGRKSVKISRERSYETDRKGDGVISDFIRVIPGNYELHLSVRMQDVKPQFVRLGIRMYDAIDIRLLYFDRNKNPIVPEQNYPQANQLLDQSFKSLPLANFKSISYAPWTRMICQTADLPFQEGDIPSQADYVKISIALKGSGTLWVDDVALRYTRANFSPFERMMRYTDTTHSQPLVIVPTPRSLKRLETIPLLQPDTRLSPVIVVDEEADETVIRAAELLRKALSASLRSHISGYEDKVDVVTASEKMIDQHSRLVFRLISGPGPTAIAADLPFGAIRTHEQGYFIHSLAGQPLIIYLGANNPQGLFYAAATTVQLVDANNPVFHNSEIVDYPWFSVRMLSWVDIGKDGIWADMQGLISELTQYKISGALFNKPQSADSIATPGAKMLNSGLFQLALPAQSFAYLESQAVRSTIKISGLGNLLNASDGFYLKGNTYLDSIRCQPFIVEKKEGMAHYCLPPFYNNELLDRYDPCPLRLPEGTVPLYGGGAYYSLHTDAFDLIRFEQYAGKRPAFIDNSMQLSTISGGYNGTYPFIPGKTRLYNLFEPFQNYSLRDLLPLLSNELFIVGYGPRMESDLIRLATAADFMWNPDEYDPELSLWHVLFTRYGKKTAADLIQYADKYGHMLEVLLRVKLHDQTSRNLRNCQVVIEQLEAISKQIGLSLGFRHPLLVELESRNRELRRQLNELTADSGKTQ